MSNPQLPKLDGSGDSSAAASLGLAAATATAIVLAAVLAATASPATPCRHAKLNAVRLVLHVVHTLLDVVVDLLCRLYERLAAAAAAAQRTQGMGGSKVTASPKQHTQATQSATPLARSFIRLLVAEAVGGVGWGRYAPPRRWSPSSRTSPGR